MAKLVAIVGAGPIGIELGVCLVRAGADVLQFDAGPIGATIHWYAPGTIFFSSPERIAIAGVPLETPNQTKATRECYLGYLRAVVKQFHLRIASFKRVVKVVGAGGGFQLEVDDVPGGSGVRQYRSDAVVLAIGDMHRPNFLGIPGEDREFVSHYLADPHLYVQRKVLLVGSGNSAVEAAVRLYRAGAEVTLSCRRPALNRDTIKYWLYPEIMGLIGEKKIRFLPNTIPAAIEAGAALLGAAGDDGACVPGSALLREDCEQVLLLTGYRQDSALFSACGVTLEGPQGKPSHNTATMETNVPGIFVAGTAAAGTQLGQVREFIETSHVHVARIVKALTGREALVGVAPPSGMPES